MSWANPQKTPMKKEIFFCLIRIKNRDFSVLKGLESVDKWGNKTGILHVLDDSIGIHVYDENGLILGSGVHTSGVSDSYIIDNMKSHGYTLEFDDRAEINTINELLEFLKQNTDFSISYNAKGELLLFHKNKGLDGFWTREKIEEGFNVKLNILDKK